jgi:hypothetical protein
MTNESASVGISHFLSCRYPSSTVFVLGQQKKKPEIDLAQTSMKYHEVKTRWTRSQDRNENDARCESEDTWIEGHQRDEPDRDRSPTVTIHLNMLTVSKQLSGCARSHYFEIIQRSFPSSCLPTISVRAALTEQSQCQNKRRCPSRTLNFWNLTLRLATTLLAARGPLSL